MKSLSAAGVFVTALSFFGCVIGQDAESVSNSADPKPQAFSELPSGTCKIEQDFLEFGQCSDTGIDKPRHKSSTIPSEQGDCSEACPRPGVPETSECGIVWGCKSTFLPYRVPFCRLAVDGCPATQTDGGSGFGPLQEVSGHAGCVALGRALLESCGADVVYAYYYETAGYPGQSVNVVRR